ncbi:hypothetical protein HK414_25650 [Ramlibacter terrae]|uniref:EamA domain-containing protein n=1 Tax=Ramlibacter terrae TaxID=2732511 RepID=A0ABX6P5W6_9BURK|nr:hypothetical protein HK414_25650 [Ramlibacter terrae]
MDLNIASKYWLILPIALLVTFGQLLAKWRSGTGGYAAGGGELQTFLRLVTDPVMIAAYGAGFIANVGWLYALTKLPLTIAFPVYMGVTFLFVLAGGFLFLGETVSAIKVASVVLIWQACRWRSMPTPDRNGADLAQWIQEIREVFVAEAPELLALFDIYGAEALFGRRFVDADLRKLPLSARLLEVGAGSMLLSCQLVREGRDVTSRSRRRPGSGTSNGCVH